MLQVEELQRLRVETHGATLAVPHSYRADSPHTQSHGPGAKPSPHSLPGHTTAQAQTPITSDKRKVAPEVSHHIVSDVVEVEQDKKQTVGPKQVPTVPANEELKEPKVSETRGKTSFQHWRSRLEHNVLDGDPGKELLYSHEEQKRKESLSRQKRQPEIINPDIVLDDLHPHHKHKEKTENIHIPAKDLKDEVLNPAEDPNNQGEDEFEEAGQQPQQQVKLIQPDEVARRPTSSHERVAQEEQLVMAGSPDQQDNLDDQYEEPEEEAGDDILEDKQEKDEEGENEEDPYSEENAEQGPWSEDIQDIQDKDHNNEEEDYKEDVDIVEDNGGPKEILTNRRAEM